jgi:hypothetical protein
MSSIIDKDQIIANKANNIVKEEEWIIRDVLVIENER